MRTEYGSYGARRLGLAFGEAPCRGIPAEKKLERTSGDVNRTCEPFARPAPCGIDAGNRTPPREI